MASPGIADFLLARFTEDEQYARTVLDDDKGSARVALPGGRTRVLAKCAADRRIALLANAARDDDDDLLDQVRVMTLRLLALPYAGHPDFREEWKP